MTSIIHVNADASAGAESSTVNADASAKIKA